jgi:twitching motility protein PilT
MARLDAVIEKLLKQAGLELVIETGAGAVIRTATGTLPVLQQKLTASQVVGAVAEILPADLRQGFPEEGTTTFPYASPAGPVSVRVDKTGDRVRAVVTPYGGGTPVQQSAPPRRAPEPEPPQEMELVPPSEMLNLAAQNVGGRPAVRGKGPEPVAIPMEDAPSAGPMKGLQPSRSAAATGSTSSGEDKAQMEELLELMLARRASDLHLASDNCPMLRVDGDIVPLTDRPVLTPEHLRAMLWTIAPEKNRKEWDAIHDTDFAHETEAARFRVNVFMDRKGIGAVLRQIPNTILSVEQMGLSKAILDLCFLPKGLVLVTGPTGSGKSTTLAAMIDYVNRLREDHIITIEDPIEFVHPNKKCLVNQREVGVHTGSFKHALRAALREDPDIVLVGEMRDLETIAIAIETAETGHLVFGTLHTNTAPSTVDRIIDQFPADRQGQIRTMLSESLKGVISQTLCKKIGGGRAAAQEVLICTSSVSNLIREGKTFQIPSAMQTGRGVGMVTMNDALFELVKKKLVDPNEAYGKSLAKGEIKAMLERGGFKLNVPGE